MPYTEITQLYHSLVNIVPEHMAALNICLVQDNLRPATLVEPDGYRNIPVDTSTISFLCQTAGLETDVWGSTRLGPSLLVWNPLQKQLIDQLYLDPSNDELFGKALGYRCLGDLNRKTPAYHHVDFVIKNPWSDNPNPFLSFICNNMDYALQQELLGQAKVYKLFVNLHRITDDLKLHIWTNTGIDIINRWV